MNEIIEVNTIQELKDDIMTMKKQRAEDVRRIAELEGDIDTLKEIIRQINEKLDTRIGQHMDNMSDNSNKQYTQISKGNKMKNKPREA